MALLELKSNTTHRGYNPHKDLSAFYTRYYSSSEQDRKNRKSENRDDSPDKSRASLIERVHSFIESLPETGIVLDLGAGRQIFEREYEDRYGIPMCRIVTLDIANIPKERLLTKSYPHLQASGEKLPFPNDLFEIIVSNMAFDFMPPETLPELKRVAKPGGLIFLNLHHQELISYDIDRELRKVAQKIKHGGTSEKLESQRRVFIHHKYLKDNRLLFETADQIREYFSQGGFEVVSVEPKTDISDKWWEVDLKKPDSHEATLAPAGTIFPR